MISKTIKWHLSMMLRLPSRNDTGKPQTVRGCVVQPGEWVSFSSDDSPAGY